MSKAVLFLAEHVEGKLAPSAARVIAAAVQIGPVDVVIATAGPEGAAAEAAQIAGVRRVLVAKAPHYAGALAEELAPLIVAQMADYAVFVMAASTTGKNIAPRVAALLDTPQISDVIAVHEQGRFDRPIYAGNAIETVECDASPLVITIRPAAFAAASGGGSAEIASVQAPSAAGLSRVVAEQPTESARPDLGAARIVISGGRGIASKENFRLVERIADRLGAAVGASRAAVDAGYAPNDYQVGQTGRIVAPELYIAVGISGAIQHLAGMKDAKIIVAVNKDADAPIFQVADYGIVGDLFEVLPALERALDR